MATTQVYANGDGTTINFSFSFPYLKTEDIKVELQEINPNGRFISSVVVTDFTIPTNNPTQIQFNTLSASTNYQTVLGAPLTNHVVNPANTIRVKIYRETNDNAVPSTFFSGSAVRAQDLNNNFDQNLYLYQELENEAVKADGGVVTGNITFDQVVTINKVPSEDTDAVNVAYLEQFVGGDSATVNTTRYREIATQGQTTVTVSPTFAVGNEVVFINGVGLSKFIEYSTPNGSTVVFTTALRAGDVIDVVSYNNLLVVSGDASFDAPPFSRNAFIATAGQTIFVCTEEYTIGKEQVFLNGALLKRGVDYTALNKVNVTLTIAALVGDLVEVHSGNYFATGISSASNSAYTYPGGVEQTVQARLEQYVSVKDFGAVGDGVTDDTAAIQAAFNAAATNKIICQVPGGIFMVSSLEMPSGLTIQGAGIDVTYFKQIADSIGPVLKSSYGSNIKKITLRDFYVDGNRPNFTVNTIYNDGIYFEGGTAADNSSCVASYVQVERTTGSGWHFGPSRHAPSLQFCYAKNCGSKVAGSDPVANATGYGIRINSCSDAYIGGGCGFGSNQNTSATVATSATPVFDGVELWWAGDDPSRPNIAFFKCPNFMVTNCNIDRTRSAGVKVTGRVGTSGQPFHENGFITNNTFLFPYGEDGFGVNGDSNFIDLSDTNGILIQGNQFSANVNDPGGSDPRIVLVNYIVKTSGGNVGDIAFVGNHWSTQQGGAPYLTAICNNYSIFSRLEASGVFTPEIRPNSGGTATTDSSLGSWYANGNSVTYELALVNIDATGLTSTDQVRIFGLLEASPLDSTYQTTGSVQLQGITASAIPISYVANIVGGNNYIEIRGIVDNANRTRLTIAELNDGIADIFVTITLPLHRPR